MIDQTLAPAPKKKNTSRHLPKHDKKVTSGPLDNLKFFKPKLSGSSQQSSKDSSSSQASTLDNVSQNTHSNDIAEPKRPPSLRQARSFSPLRRIPRNVPTSEGASSIVEPDGETVTAGSPDLASEMHDVAGSLPVPVSEGEPSHIPREGRDGSLPVPVSAGEPSHRSREGRDGSPVPVSEGKPSHDWRSRPREGRDVHTSEVEHPKIKRYSSLDEYDIRILQDGKPIE